jgi:hypothetical protein
VRRSPSKKLKICKQKSSICKLLMSKETIRTTEYLRTSDSARGTQERGWPNHEPAHASREWFKLGHNLSTGYWTRKVNKRNVFERSV